MRRAVLGILPLACMVLLTGLAVTALLNTPSSAQEAPKVCRAAMIFDRSGSVDLEDPRNTTTIKNQIKRLFEPGGLNDSKIELAFWSFAHQASGSSGNYNAPFYGYVSSRGHNSAFDNQLNTIVSDGDTNYEQAFGYDGGSIEGGTYRGAVYVSGGSYRAGTRNPALSSIIDATDVLVFMTDGKPTAPKAGPAILDLHEAYNGELGRQVALREHLSKGRKIIGGSIGQNNREMINYVITGDRNNGTRTFDITTSYGDLADRLREEIRDACKDDLPRCTVPGLEHLYVDDPLCVPPPAKCTIPGLEYLNANDPLCVPPVQPPYGLIPSVESDSDVSGVASQGSIELTYKVGNESLENDSPVTSWSITRVVVSPNKNAENLKNWTGPRDNYSCLKLRTDVLWDDCQPDFKSGSRTFPRGPGVATLSDSEVGDASRIVIDDTWAVGTKVCYILVVTKPTQANSPINRYSKPVCLTIGKRPTLQILGGDVSVGRKFASDPQPLPANASAIQTSLTVKSKVYGSWAEYGAFAPGVISGLATAAGLEGGYDTGLVSVGNAQSYWSELTFANKSGYGSFTSPGIIGDGPSALLAANAIVEPIQTSVGEKTFDGAVASGIYQKQSGDLTLHGGQLAPGSSVILHVPDGTVTIDGNITYFPGPYTDIKDIPRLVIIAKRINIQANVENVDAWLVARNKPGATNGFAGTINTCSNAPDNLTIHECNLRLQINGPVMARHLLLRRTAGSGTGEDNKNPAEIINLRADIYMSSLARGSDVIIPTTTYSVELPPRF